MNNIIDRSRSFTFECESRHLGLPSEQSAPRRHGWRNRCRPIGFSWRF